MPEITVSAWLLIAAAFAIGFLSVWVIHCIKEHS